MQLVWSKMFMPTTTTVFLQLELTAEDEAAFDSTVTRRLSEIVNKKGDRAGMLLDVSILKSDITGSTNKYIAICVIDGVPMGFSRMFMTTEFPPSIQVTVLGSYRNLAQWGQPVT